MIMPSSMYCICVCIIDDEDAYDDDYDEDNAVTTATTNTRVTAVAAAVNGLTDTVDDKLLEWLSSCNAAQDDTIHRVSIKII